MRQNERRVERYKAEVVELQVENQRLRDVVASKEIIVEAARSGVELWESFSQQQVEALNVVHKECELQMLQSCDKGQLGKTNFTSY